MSNPEEQNTEQSILDQLTEEERAALNDSDYIEDDDESGQEVSNAAEEADDEAAGDIAEEEVEPQPEEVAEPEEEAAAPETEGDKANHQQQSVAPDLQEKMDEYDTQLAEIKAERADLKTKLLDGDIGDDEWSQALEALDEKSSAIIAEKAVTRHALEQDANNWKDACNAYLKEHPGLKESDDVLKAFDAAVRYVTGSAASQNMTFAQQLQRAHAQLEFDAQYSGLAGVPPTAKAKTAPQPKPKPATKPTQKAEPKGEDMRTPPPTLANVPASDISGKNDSPFASLQALIEKGNPDEIEAAYMKLSPEQRDQFSSMDVG